MAEAHPTLPDLANEVDRMLATVLSNFHASSDLLVTIHARVLSQGAYQQNPEVLETLTTQVANLRRQTKDSCELIQNIYAELDKLRKTGQGNTGFGAAAK